MYTFLADMGTFDLGGSLTTGMILLVVVFVALAALSIVINLFGKTTHSDNKTTAKAVNFTPVEKAPSTKTKAVAAPVADDEDEIAAVIAAAVAMMAPPV